MIPVFCIRAAVAFLTVSICLLCSFGYGQVVHDWNNGAGGSYNFSFNWTPGNVPDNTAESARFNLASTYDVLLSFEPTVSDLLVNDGDVTLSQPAISFGDLTYTVDDDAIITGAIFTLEETLSTDDIFLGVKDRLEVHDTAFLNVSDGSDIAVEGQLRIGAHLSGNGQLALDGTGTTLITSNANAAIIGASGSMGTLNISDSATGTIGGALHLGQSNATGSAAEVNLSTNATLDVAGDLNMVSLGSTNQTGVLIVNATTTFTIDGDINIGAGTGTTQTTAVMVGGTFTQNGTSTFNLGTSTGAGNTSNFAVNTGGIATTGTGNITIGDTGTLDIQGGTFNAGNAITMTSGSTVTLNGGELNATSGLDNTANGTLNFQNGMLTVTGGAFSPNAGGDYFIDGPTPVEMPHLVVGVGATANLNQDLHIARIHNGELTIAAGGQVTNTNGRIASLTGSSTGIVTVTGVGSTWTNSNFLTVGSSGNGTLSIEDGGQVISAGGTIGGNTASNFVTVTGIGSTWTNSGILNVGEGGGAILSIESGGQVSNTDGTIGGSNANTVMVTVMGTGSTWTNSGELTVGNFGEGTLQIKDQGQVSSSSGILGKFNGDVGTVTVSNAGSEWNTNILTVGDEGHGSLNIADGATVSAGVVSIAEDTGSGEVTVDNASLTISSGVGSGNLFVGSIGDATLDVLNAGVVSSVNGIMSDEDPGATSVATVDGLGSMWQLIDNLDVGVNGTATLNVNNNGLVTVGSATTVSSNSTVAIGGGRLEFGTTDFDSFSRITGTSGSLEGDLPTLTGYTDVATLPSSQLKALLDLSEVRLTNNGYLFGYGTPGVALINSSLGEVETTTGERMRFDNGTNDGQITLTGGQIHFTQSFTNNSAGLVIGNGTFRADGGMTNEGDIAFSATANVIGDMTNNAAGTIISAGGSTTFFDDVVNNGEIRTAINSATVYFGSYSGLGDTGTGTVIMEGDLKPGSSPGMMAFGGDLSFGLSAGLEIELGGLLSGDFDQLDIAGDFSLAGNLMISLINGFQLSQAMEFMIAEVDGDLLGTFAGLADGALVGSFGGTDLFIDYDGGDGNDVVLYTAGLAGDFNNDGIVDAADYTVWRDGLGTTYTQADYDVWVNNYGQVASLSHLVESSSVPEPSAAFLLFSLIALSRVVPLRTELPEIL